MLLPKEPDQVSVALSLIVPLQVSGVDTEICDSSGGRRKSGKEREA